MVREGAGEPPVLDVLLCPDAIEDGERTPRLTRWAELLFRIPRDGMIPDCWDGAVFGRREPGDIVSCGTKSAVGPSLVLESVTLDAAIGTCLRSATGASMLGTGTRRTNVCRCAGSCGCDCGCEWE